MAFNYARAQATAKRLIKNFGQTGAILKKDPQTGHNPGKPTFTPQPVDMVVLDYSAQEIFGTSIASTDKKIFVESSVSIELDDRIRDASGNVYEIVPPLEPLAPAGIVVLYEVQGRV